MNWYSFFKISNNIIEHLNQRGVNENNTRFHLNEDKTRAYFPLWNGMGQLIGYQKYYPEGSKNTKDLENQKYHTIVPNNAFKGNVFWNLDGIDINSISYLFLTEGIFKSVKIRNLGYPTVALLGNSPSDSAKNQIKLWKSKNIKIIGVLDNDKAGQKLKSVCDTYCTVPNPYKDIDDMPEEEAKKFLENCLNSI
jgi:hypothetical protein